MEPNLILQPLVVAILAGAVLNFAKTRAPHTKRKLAVKSGAENPDAIFNEEQNRIKDFEAKGPFRNAPMLLLPVLILAVAGGYSIFSLVAAWIVACLTAVISGSALFDFSGTSPLSALLNLIVTPIILAFTPAYAVLMLDCIRVVFL